MLLDATWILLHGGTHGSGPVSFETVLASVVAVLVLVGTLFYVGALGSADATGGDDHDSGVGD